MRQGQPAIGQSTEISKAHSRDNNSRSDDFVLEKTIFNNIFEKDIRRVFIYKKTERLAKAIHLIAPAFAGSASLRDRIDKVAISIMDAALLPPGTIRIVLPRELLALSSMLSLARTGGLLSTMNAELIVREAHILLQEVASYEEPRLSLDDIPTLSDIAKSTASKETHKATSSQLPQKSTEEHIKDISDKKTHIKDRREAILSIIKNKGTSNIKDISTLIRGVSEKTIQRELIELINEGVVLKQGERRWSTYTLAN